MTEVSASALHHGLRCCLTIFHFCSLQTAPWPINPKFTLISGAWGGRVMWKEKECVSVLEKWGFTSIIEWLCCVHILLVFSSSITDVMHYPSGASRCLARRRRCAVCPNRASQTTTYAMFTIIFVVAYLLWRFTLEIVFSSTNVRIATQPLVVHSMAPEDAAQSSVMRIWRLQLTRFQNMNEMLPELEITYICQMGNSFIGYLLLMSLCANTWKSFFCRRCGWCA